jgi:Carboxypeptidase regulatory-like domain
VKQSLKGWSLLCILSAATFSFGQNASTSMRGTVKDSSNAMVPGATIVLTDSANGASYKAVSNSNGAYIFPVVSPARYLITVTSSGFATQTRTAELLVNQPATIDFTLSVQANTVTVDVSASAQTLNTTDASLGNSADNELIQALPSETRNVPDLLSLQPGVLYLPTTGDSRSGTVNGIRSDQGNITIDGVDDNDQVNGYAFFGVLRETQDSVEEFRVTTANANVDEGRSAGAQVSLVTKSGTNKFHGGAYEYNRPTITVANDWFNKQAELNSGLANVPGKLIRNIFGAAVGGPIKTDKFFFFGNYEGQRLAESQEVVQTVPTTSYQAGNLTYQGDTASGGITNVVLTPAQVTTLDAGCQVCNTAAYSPGPGPNPNALKYFQSMPANNGLTEGDALNEGSYSFASPAPSTLNTSIARLDYTPNDRHKIFARGNLQKDTSSGTENFPGQGPAYIYEDNTKGMIFGDTWVISPTVINDIRYGYIRQGNSNHGAGSGDYVNFRFLSTPTAENRTTVAWVPVNNIVDNFNWTKGKHSIEFGANWRLIHQNRVSDANSYSGASTNPYWLGGNPPDPSSPTGLNNLPVDGGFTNSYLIAYANMVGTVPSVSNQYNYKITNATTGSLLADGESIGRHFSAQEYEYYVQDAWRLNPKLTITFGIRHTILQTPHETSGQQVAPTIDTHAWFLERESQATKSEVYEPALTFAPTGPFYNKPGFWPKSKDNIAPRFAIAFSPNPRTSIRAGAGLFYDHYGEALVNTFDQNGSFGVSSNITNPAGIYGYENSPRFVSRNTLPFSNGTAPATSTFPYSPPTGYQEGFAITWGLDSQFKTPYTEAFNTSFQHEMGKGFLFEAAYVGTLGRHLAQSRDLAEPVDYVDPGGAGDYYTAGTKLSKAVDANGGNFGLVKDSHGNPIGSTNPVSAIQYFENVFPWMANLDYQGESATQAIYNNEWAPYRSNLGATSALADLDFYGPLIGFYPAPAGYQPHFWQGQFSSLYALSSIGTSDYHAGQFTLRHPSSHGFQLDVSYTWSHSIDIGSDAERSGGWATGSFSDILNTWKPRLNRGNSDFDTRHLLTVDGVYQLPFGRGKAVLGSANRVADAIIGGWQLSGIERATSGLPWSLFEPGWTTDWQIEDYGVITGNVKTHRHFDQNGDPQYFNNAAAINSGLSYGTPVRLPYPGEAGQRNNLRGDGYFDLDTGLTKKWSLPEKATMKFAWEIYNVTNTVRFDPASIGSGLTGGNLGIASSLLSSPRRMQFSLRVDF